MDIYYHSFTQDLMTNNSQNEFNNPPKKKNPQQTTLLHHHRHEKPLQKKSRHHKALLKAHLPDSYDINLFAFPAEPTISYPSFFQASQFLPPAKTPPTTSPPTYKFFERKKEIQNPLWKISLSLSLAVLAWILYPHNRLFLIITPAPLYDSACF